MKSINYYLLFLVFTIFACSSPQKSIESGNYDQAINDAVLSLKKNPDNSKQALYLQEAYNKATAEDLARIEQLEQNAAQNPENWVEIFSIYDGMEIREIAVIPVLPLYADGRELELNMPDVSAKLEQAKINASSELYGKANNLLAQGDRQSAREAYELFDQLVEFNFNYRDARSKREQAKIAGSTNVYVEMNNQTGTSLPSAFKTDLLSFREGSFTDPWILYSATKEPGVVYDYNVDLNISQLIVGRDQEQQRQYREQNRVVVGYDTRKDSEGNAVRVPRYANVYADVLEVRQYKPIRIAGQVVYKDKTGTTLATIPVEREEAWQNIYAQFRGDQRALSQETVQKIQNGEQPFPSEQEFYEISGKLLNQVVVQVFEENASNLQ